MVTSCTGVFFMSADSYDMVTCRTEVVLFMSADSACKIYNLQLNETVMVKPSYLLGKGGYVFGSVG